MSLISDALRRARQNAGGDRRSGPTLPGPLGQPPRRNRPSSLAVVVVAVVAAAVAGGAVWLVVHRSSKPGREARTAMRTPTGAVTTPTVAPPESAAAGPARPRRSPAVAAAHGQTPGSRARIEPAGTRSTSALPSASPRVAVQGVRGTPPPAMAGKLPIPGRAVSDEARRVALGRRQPRPTRRPAPRKPVQASPKPVKQPTRAVAAGPTRRVPKGGSSTGVRELVGEGRVNGVRLTLDYLVFRSKDPFAQINGVEVHVGSEVEGFKVMAVGEDAVRLMGPGGPVILRVR